MMDWSKIGDWSSEITDRGRDDYWRERNENQLRSNMEYNAALQREFAQHGIQWKVADAQAAGVHPLYALGGGTPSFSPGASVSEGGVTHHASQSSSQLYETGEQREMRFEQLRAVRANAEKDEAQASYYGALEAVERQKLNPQPRTLLNGDGGSGQGQGVVIPDWDVNNPGNVGMVQLQGDPVVSHQEGDQSMGAGSRKPFWSEYQVTQDGLRIALPWTQEGPGEALENVAWWMWPSIIRMNQTRYGSDWLGQFIKQVVMGKAPEYRHVPLSARRWNKPDEVLQSSGRERGVNWRSNRQYFFGR